MPLIDENIYDQIINSRKNNEIIVPTYKGQQGNPVLFSKSIKRKLMTIEGDVGGKKILQLNKDKVFSFNTTNENIIKDFNTKENFNF